MPRISDAPVKSASPLCSAGSFTAPTRTSPRTLTVGLLGLRWISATIPFGRICRVAVSIVEVAPKDELYANPQHPYTRALLDAVPRADPERVRGPVIGGEVPSLLAPPPGCRFHTRCPHVMPRCRTDIPELRVTAPGRQVACHLNVS